MFFQHCKDLLLCMWCKTILKKLNYIKNLALKNEKIVRAYDEVRLTVKTMIKSVLIRLEFTSPRSLCRGSKLIRFCLLRTNYLEFFRCEKTVPYNKLSNAVCSNCL